MRDKKFQTSFFGVFASFFFVLFKTTILTNCNNNCSKVAQNTNKTNPRTNTKFTFVENNAQSKQHKPEIRHEAGD